MKKLLIVLIAAVGVILYSASALVLFTADKNARYTVYTDGFNQNEYVLNAFTAYKTCFFESEKGLSVKPDADFDCEKFIKSLSAEKIFTESCEGIKLTYYRSPFIKNYITLKNEKINLEIAQKPNGEIIIGTPIILGSI